MKRRRDCSSGCLYRDTHQAWLADIEAAHRYAEVMAWIMLNPPPRRFARKYPDRYERWAFLEMQYTPGPDLESPAVNFAR